MFERVIEQSLLQGNVEKSFIDKLLAREDISRIRDLIKKPKLSRSELLELMYMLLSTESKLVNYGEWDRYVILKFFVWIREFIKVAELLYDYQEDLKKKEEDGTSVLSSRTKRLLDNNERLIEHNAKFLIDLYLNIARTSLSIGATGLMEILTNRYELHYPSAGVAPAVEQKRSLFGLKGGR